MRSSDPDFLPKGVGFADPAIAGGRRNFRIVDAWNPETRTALESKVGAQTLDKVKHQIDHDAALLANQDYDQVVWHFFPSAASGKVADDPELFAYLTQKGIPYEIHLP